MSEVLDQQVEEETAETYIKAGTNFIDEDGEKQRVEAGFTFNVGSDLTEAVDLYGEEIVYERYSRGVIKDGGNAIRSGLNKYLNAENNTLSPDEIVAKVTEELQNWRPDVSRRAVRKDAGKSILDNFSTMSPERQQEILAELTAKAAVTA